MSLFSSIRSLASAFLQRGRVNREMDDELRSHLHHRADDLQRAGISRAEAQRRARLEFGGFEKFKEEAREARAAISSKRFFRTSASACGACAAHPD